MQIVIDILDKEYERNASYDKNCWKSIYTSNSTAEPEWRKNQYGLGLASNDNDYTRAKKLVDRVKK